MASPLAEPTIDSINALYNADPLNLTNDDLDVMIEDHLKNQKLWKKEDGEAKSQGRSRKPSVYKRALPPGQLKLEDLGLDGAIDIPPPKEKKT